MATNYPTGFDTFPSAPATLDGTPLHSDMHRNVQDAVQALETAVGLSPAGWAASMKARLDALEQAVGTLLYIPPSAQNTSTGGGAWVNMGSINVPTWAQFARVQLHVTGAYSSVTETMQYSIFPSIGGTNGTAALIQANTASNRFAFSTVSLIAVAAGSQTVLVNSTRIAGTGVFTGDGSSDFMMAIDYRR